MTLTAEIQEARYALLANLHAGNRRMARIWATRLDNLYTELYGS